jgi:hypothetical protein
MLHDLRTAPTEAPRFDNDDRLTEYTPQAAAAYALAMKGDGATSGQTRFSMFDKNDRSMFFASAVMMLLPLLGGYYFNR